MNATSFSNLGQRPFWLLAWASCVTVGLSKFVYATATDAAFLLGYLKRFPSEEQNASTAVLTMKCEVGSELFVCALGVFTLWQFFRGITIRRWGITFHFICLLFSVWNLYAIGRVSWAASRTELAPWSNCAQVLLGCFVWIPCFLFSKKMAK